MIELNPDVDWDLTPAQAIQLQQRLRHRVITENRLPEPIQTVAGVDVGFEAQGRISRAAAVVLEYPSMRPLTQVLVRRPTCFPYVPGLLSFRELPVILEALSQLEIIPDLVLCDGQGIAHPRGFGIACHLGVLTGLATVGVAKTRLVGEYQEPLQRKGDWSPLLYRQQRIGAVVRTRTGVKPLFVSPGHRIDVEGSVKLVLACSGGYKLPEPTRLADKLASCKRARPAGD